MSDEEREALLSALHVEYPITAQECAAKLGWTIETTEARLAALKSLPHPPIFSFAPNDDYPERRYQSVLAWIMYQ